MFEALPPGLPRVISVGRLDLNSEGLLLLTNDGGLARALELPASGWVRRYRARARGRIDQARLDTLKDGITVEGVRYGAIEATLDKAKEGPTGRQPLDHRHAGRGQEPRGAPGAGGAGPDGQPADPRLPMAPSRWGPWRPGAVEEVGPRVIREQLGQVIAPRNMPKGDRALFKPSTPAAPSRRGPAAKGARPSGADTAPAAPERKVYKAGWAKPKAKIKPASRPKTPKPRRAP